MAQSGCTLQRLFLKAVFPHHFRGLPLVAAKCRENQAFKNSGFPLPSGAGDLRFTNLEVLLRINIERKSYI